MKSSGLTSLQISYPILVIGMIFSSLLFLNFHFLLPKSYSFYKNYEDNLRYKKLKFCLMKIHFIILIKKHFLHNLLMEMN